MAHFALLDENNIVIFVTAGSDHDDGREEELSARTGQVYKQTSYNTKGGVYYDAYTNEPAEDQTKAFRKNYAGLGFTYDYERDAFIPPKQFESWVLDEETCLWNPPIKYPEDGKVYEWSEDDRKWVELNLGEA